MKDDKGDFVPLFGLVQKGIAEVDLSKLTPPEQVRPEKVAVVGHCDDYLKKVYTFGARVASEHTRLTEEARELAHVILGGGQRFLKVSDWISLIIKSDEGRRERLRIIEDEIQIKKALATLASKIFQEGVQHRFPDTQKYAVSAIYNDWSIGGREEEEVDTTVYEEMIRAGLR